MPGSRHQSCANSGDRANLCSPHCGPCGLTEPSSQQSCQGWPLTPNHSYSMPLSVPCHSPRIPSRLCHLQEALPDHSGTELLHRRPSGLSPALVFTRMCVSCGCTLITQTDQMFPEGTDPTQPPLLHSPIPSPGPCTQ